MENWKVNIRQIVEELEKGKKSVNQIRDLLNQRQGLINGRYDDDDKDYYKGLDCHSMVVLTALEYALTALHNSKKDHKDFVIAHPKKDKRGCYKRRKGEEAVIMETPILTDDGFAWRKYGQKVILHSTHPRNYYRCTHRAEEECMATKQVQQISEIPKIHRVTYHGKHTCKLNPQFSLNSTITPIEYPNSSVYLTFDTDTNTPSSTQPLNFSFSSSGAMVKHEQHGPVKEETHESEQSDLIQQYSNSSPSTSTTTPSSVVLDDPFDSCVASPHRMDYDHDRTMGEDFSELDLWLSIYDHQ